MKDTNLMKELELIENLIPKDKKNLFEESGQRIKAEYDILYFRAYYDVVYNVGTMNLLKNIYKNNLKEKPYLIGFKFEKDLFEYNYDDLLCHLQKIKNEVKQITDCTICYYDKMFLVLCNEKKEADYLRRVIKRTNTDSFINKCYFEIVDDNQDKSLKFITGTYKKLNTRMNEVKNNEQAKI